MNKLASLGAYRLSLYLKEYDCESAFDRFGALLDKNADRKAFDSIDLYDFFDPEIKEEKRIRKILYLCGDNPVAQACFELAAFRLMDERVGEILKLSGDDCGGYVTLEAAARTCGYETIFDAEELIRDAWNRLKTVLAEKKEGRNIPRKKLYIDEILESYISGKPALPGEYEGHVRIFDRGSETRTIFGYGEQFRDFAYRISACLENMKRTGDKDTLTVIISGEKECGRTTAAVTAAEELGMGLASMDADFLFAENRFAGRMEDFVRFCMLNDLLPGIYGIPAQKGTAGYVREIRNKTSVFGNMPLFLICDSRVKPLPYISGRALSLEVEVPDAARSYELWKGMLEQAGMAESIDADELASKLNLTAGQIKRTVDLLKISSICSLSELQTRDVYKIVYKVLDDGRYDNIRRVDSEFRLDDVKTDDRNRAILKEICNQVRYRRRVYTTWDMKSKYEYGRCVSCILAGPPGTGKTMAVRALSSELGLELYKVDLSQLVDKYIGETEKRLEEVFTKAEKSNMILFFDEADAIMGKRTETTDAKDKYANTEIAYILQRIEEYDGIVILATNYLQNIDPAFMRRIRYVVNFEIPETSVRMEIWKSAFAPAVPLSGDIDWDYLAENFRLSGGSIKNIVLNSAFMAAADESPVSMKHIIKAIARENSKDKRVAFADDFGKYGYLTKD